MADKTDLLLSEYLRSLQKASANFQLIEEALKRYLDYIYSIISKKLQNIFPYKYSYEDVRNDSLGKLLQKFKKFNENQDLIKKIENIVKDRNYCAHKGYLITLEGQKDNVFLSKEIKKMKKILADAEECAKSLMLEIENLHRLENMSQKSRPHFS